jgi:hypothetical protein
MTNNTMQYSTIRYSSNSHLIPPQALSSCPMRLSPSCSPVFTKPSLADTLFVVLLSIIAAHPTFSQPPTLPYHPTLDSRPSPSLNRPLDTTPDKTSHMLHVLDES